jgi:WbqC-like protein family
MTYDMKKVAILQSNYIPWKGYFDIIAAVDEFILLDDVQFTKNDWRNRNKVKTPLGAEWISIPVGKNLNRRIRDVMLPNDNWQKKHWKTLVNNYGRAAYFNEIASWLKPLYCSLSYTHLSQVNRSFIEAVCGYLSIKTKITNSWEYAILTDRTERLVDMCIQAGGTEYVSGPAGKNYIEEDIFKARGVKLTFFDYAGYSEYPQLWDKFIHEVSIIDLLFNCGVDSPHYMKCVLP